MYIEKKTRLFRETEHKRNRMRLCIFQPIAEINGFSSQNIHKNAKYSVKSFIIHSGHFRFKLPGST